MIKDENFDSLVLEASHTTPVVLDIGATWCMPCRMLEPIFDKLKIEYEGKIKFLKCDVDEEKNVPSELGVSAIPAVFIFKNGLVVDKFVGLKSEKEFKEILDKLI